MDKNYLEIKKVIEAEFVEELNTQIPRQPNLPTFYDYEFIIAILIAIVIGGFLGLFVAGLIKFVF